MAVGDKLPVVMGREKAVPNGVATLGADGILAEAQRPTYTAQQVGAVQAPATAGSENQALILGADGRPIWSSLTPSFIGAADLTLSNLSNYQKALRNIGGAPRRNLLHNAYFVGGGSQQGGGQFPINQRGETSYAVNGYGIDRWRANSSDMTVAVTAGGITVSLSAGEGDRIIFEQVLPFMLSGQMCTLTILTADGELYSGSAVFPASGYTTVFAIPNIGDARLNNRSMTGDQSVYLIINRGASIQIAAAKLELGPTQTLAYQDEEGNWQLFETPDYGEELAKCQRYLLVGPLVGIPCVGAYVVIPTPVTLRTVPTAFGTADAFRQDTNQAVSGVSFTVTALNNDSVTCMINGLSTGFEVPYYLNIPAASGLSAEL